MMARGAVYYNNTELKLYAILDCNEHGYFVDFFEDDQKIGRVLYYDNSSHYAESAAENFVNGFFPKDELINHIDQMEFDFG